MLCRSRKYHRTIFRSRLRRDGFVAFILLRPGWTRSRQQWTGIFCPTLQKTQGRHRDETEKDRPSRWPTQFRHGRFSLDTHIRRRHTVPLVESDGHLFARVWSDLCRLFHFG